MTISHDLVLPGLLVDLHDHCLRRGSANGRHGSSSHKRATSPSASDSSLRPCPDGPDLRHFRHIRVRETHWPPERLAALLLLRCPGLRVVQAVWRRSSASRLRSGVTSPRRIPVIRRPRALARWRSWPPGPALHALLAHRVAHALYGAGVPAAAAADRGPRPLPLTGIEIHPAAVIGTGLVHRPRDGRRHRRDRGDRRRRNDVPGGDAGRHRLCHRQAPSHRGGQRHDRLGAKLLGPITVGHGAKIGANTVVIHDVPPNSHGRRQPRPPGAGRGSPARGTRRRLDPPARSRRRRDQGAVQPDRGDRGGRPRSPVRTVGPGERAPLRRRRPVAPSPTVGCLFRRWAATLVQRGGRPRPGAAAPRRRPQSARLGSGRFSGSPYRSHVAAGADQVQRSALDLVVDLSHVLPDDPDRDQLDPAQAAGRGW